MGAFLSSNKNGYFWFLLGYLQDKNVYVRDARLIPYTPGQSQTYVDFYPNLYNAIPAIQQTLQLKINGQQVASAKISQPNGVIYADLKVPAGAFTLTTWLNGAIIKTEQFLSKNYAMLLGVSAQSYDDRNSQLQLVQADQNFEQMRSQRLYDILGSFFNFPPPPGWPVEMYRGVLMGSCGPGLRQAFFDGATKAGIIEVIEAITCQPPQILPGNKGIRWVVRTRANSQPSNPAIRGFFVTIRADDSRAFLPPHYRAICCFENWWGHAAYVVVNGSSRTPPPESLLHKTNSYIEAPISGDYAVAGKMLSFSIGPAGSSSPTNYSVTFPSPGGGPNLTAAQAAAAIVSAYPPLAPATYGTPQDRLRVGVPPQAGVVNRITILGGSALSAFGWIVGQTVDIATDQLNNPWLTTPVQITGPNGGLWVDGVDFNSVPSTGQIVWNPSTATNLNPPPAAGTILTANYTYQMRREIMQLVGQVKATNDIIQYEWD